MGNDIDYLSKEKSVNLYYSSQDDNSSQGEVCMTYYDVLDSIFDFRGGVDIRILSYVLGMTFYFRVKDKTIISRLRFARDGLFLDINVLSDMMKHLELDEKVKYIDGLYFITEEGKKDLLEYSKAHL